MKINKKPKGSVRKSHANKYLLFFLCEESVSPGVEPPGQLVLALAQLLQPLRRHAYLPPGEVVGAPRRPEVLPLRRDPGVLLLQALYLRENTSNRLRLIFILGHFSFWLHIERKNIWWNMCYNNMLHVQSLNNIIFQNRTAPSSYSFINNGNNNEWFMTFYAMTNVLVSASI